MGQNNKNHLVSLIFPVYKENGLLKPLKNLAAEFQKRNQKLEMMAVFDEGLSTGKSKLKLIPGIKMLSYPLKKFGKGFALCYGFSQSNGCRVFFWEGNFPIKSKQLFLYLDLMSLVKADIVVGSKRHSLSEVSYPLPRQLYSQLYQNLTRLLFGLNTRDTQVGLKLYRRKVLNTVIPKLIIKNWGFDLEILVAAHQAGFKKTIEAPIEIKKAFTHHGIQINFVFNLLKDTLAIFYRQKLLRFYDRK